MRVGDKSIGGDDAGNMRLAGGDVVGAESGDVWCKLRIVRMVCLTQGSGLLFFYFNFPFVFIFPFQFLCLLMVMVRKGVEDGFTHTLTFPSQKTSVSKGLLICSVHSKSWISFTSLESNKVNYVYIIFFCLDDFKLIYLSIPSSRFEFIFFMTLMF